MAREKRNGVHGEDGATFEQSFRRLQEVVQTLSEGNLTLQEALASFEEGMQLADLCTSMLDNAELRLRQVGSGVARPSVQPANELDGTLDESLGAGDSQDGRLIAIDMQQVESTLVFEVPRPAPLSASPGSLRAAAPPDEGQWPPKAGPAGARPGKMEPDTELDPLFDEDD